MKKLLFLVLMIYPVSILAQDITGRSIPVDKTLFSKRTISAGATIKSEWIDIGVANIFNLFIDIDGAVSTTDLDIAYQTRPVWSGGGDSTTVGYWKAGVDSAIVLYSFAIADSTNGGRRYISFHSSASKAIALCKSVQLLFTNQDGVAAITVKSAKLLGQP